MSMKQKRFPEFSVHAINQWFTSNRWMPHCVQKTAAVRFDALWSINKRMPYLLANGSETLTLPGKPPCSCGSVHHRPATPVFHWRL
jgi:hypothetical protein